MIAITPCLTLATLPKREGPPKAFVLHGTGAPLMKALALYRKGSVQPHYVIACNGIVYQTAPDDRVAWHCKIGKLEAALFVSGYQEWSRYKWDQENGKPVLYGDEFPGYREWRDTWLPKGIKSPLQLVTGRHPNNVSIGIEMESPELKLPDQFTPQQYESCAELLKLKGKEHGIPLDRDHVIGHFDANPMTRGGNRPLGNWDPGYRFKFHRLFDLLR